MAQQWERAGMALRLAVVWRQCMLSRRGHTKHGHRGHEQSGTVPQKVREDHGPSSGSGAGCVRVVCVGWGGGGGGGGAAVPAMREVGILFGMREAACRNRKYCQ